MTETVGDMASMRVSDADRNGTMLHLHNAVALGLIDIDEFEQRSSHVSFARTAASWTPGQRPARTGRDRHLRGRPGGTARLGRFAETPRRMDGAHPARAGAPGGLDRTRPHQGSLRRAGGGHRTRHEVRLARPSIARRASASIDDVEVYVGSASDRRKDPPAEGDPHVVLTGRVVCGSVIIRGPRRSLLRRPQLPDSALSQLGTAGL